MEAYIEVELVTVSSSEADHAQTDLKTIFFDGIEYPEVKIRSSESRDAGSTNVKAKVEIMNLAGEEDIEDIRSHFDQQLLKAVQSGEVLGWNITAVCIDGQKTRVDWSSPGEEAAIQP